MTAIRMTLLGTPGIERDGEPVTVDTRKATALLAYLGITGKTHTRDAIAALLWPQADQSGARAALRRTLSVLKSAVGEGLLAITRETIGFTPGASPWIDVVEFHRTLSSLQTHGHPVTEVCPACTPALEKAVDLYQGDFMAGFGLRDSPSFDDWQYLQSEALRQELAGALQRLVRAYVQQGDYRRALMAARRWLALDELREDAHRQLMQLYAWSGQRNAALRQYQECVKILDRELGVRPLPETVRLYHAIRDHRLPAPATRPAPQAAPAPSQAAAWRYPLVGRTSEWQALMEHSAGLSTGNGRFIVLEGEAGIGKTRLAGEFIAQARAGGGQAVTAGAYEGETGLTYGLFVEVLRAAIRQLTALAEPAGPAQLDGGLPPSVLSELGRLLPELAQNQPAPPPMESPGAQARFFSAVAETLQAALSGPAPQILFLDDLHWADDASLDLLAFLVRRLKDWPVIILAAWRSEDLPAESHARRLLAESTRAGYGAQIHLTPLEAASVSDLVQAVFSGVEAENREMISAQELSERLFQESEGSPFFLIEYLHLLSAEPSRFETYGSENWVVPSSVRELLHSRLNMLDEMAAQVLQSAAVIGRSFDFDVLRAASGRSEEEAISALEELDARGLVHEAELNDGGPSGRRGPGYIFSHDKLRALVYEETSLARRRLLHRRVAEALIERAHSPAELRPQAGQIAHHARAAGQPGLAAEYYALAGEHARCLYANQEALVHYQTALSLGHPSPREINLALGELYTLQGEYPAAQRCYETAAALSHPGTFAIAQASHHLGDLYYRQGAWDRAERYFREALDTLESRKGAGHNPDLQEGDKEIELRARLLADWGRACYHQGRPAEALDLGHRALQVAEASTDFRTQAQAHNMLGMLARSQERLEDARYHLERSQALATELGEPEGRIAAGNNLALVHAARGELAEAIQAARQALDLCRLYGDRHREAAIANNLADLYHASGQPEQAMEALKTAVVIFSEIGSRNEQAGPEIWKLTEW